jgi:hypothetical protein
MPCSFRWKDCYCYLLQRMWLEYITKLQEGYLRTCCKSDSQSGRRDTGIQTCSTNDKPTSQEITNKTLPDHSTGQKWSLLLCTHSLCSQSFTEVPFQNQSKFETWHLKLDTLNLDLLCKVSKRFLRGIFKSTTDFIQFILSEHSAFLLLFGPPMMLPV